MNTFKPIFLALERDRERENERKNECLRDYINNITLNISELRVIETFTRSNKNDLKDDREKKMRHQ